MSRCQAALLAAALATFAGCAREGEDATDPADGLLAIGLEGRARLAVAAEPEWWRTTVFYEIFVRSFADSSSGPLAGDGIGDLNGLVEKLDYLNDGDPATAGDLGVGGLWLMPIAQSPSYHGYDVTDYYTVEKDYGTNEDFRRFVDEAHRRGIRVLVDLVLNHTSDRHPWFLEAAQRRSTRQHWYIWSHEKRDYLGPWGQPVWHQLPWWLRGWRHFDYLAYYGIFWSGMPDLDYRNPEVTRAMFDVARFWLEDMDVDGFRLDAVRHLIEVGARQNDTEETHAWLRRFHDFCRSVDPNVLLVGEIWSDAEDIATYGADELDLAFHFPMAHETLTAVRTGSSAALLSEADKLPRLFPGSRFATFLSNHDQRRVMSFLGGSETEARLAATLLLTGPGVPFIYYGEEIGLSGVKPDPLIRRPDAVEWGSPRRVLVSPPLAAPRAGLLGAQRRSAAGRPEFPPGALPRPRPVACSPSGAFERRVPAAADRQRRGAGGAPIRGGRGTSRRRQSRR